MNPHQYPQPSYTMYNSSTQPYGGSYHSGQGGRICPCCGQPTGNVAGVQMGGHLGAYGVGVNAGAHLGGGHGVGAHFGGNLGAQNGNVGFQFGGRNF